MSRLPTNQLLRQQKQRRAVWATLLFAIVGGSIFIWWSINRANSEMRSDLLHQAASVAQIVNVDHVKLFTGTELDLQFPDYHRLKEQLIAIRTANSQCRFIYLWGLNADRKIYFLIDSEPIGSEGYSPPGQIYEEMYPSDMEVFDKGIPAVSGPLPDRWGTWVTALVPVVDPKTKKVLFVLGMDVDARTWNWDIAARISLPVGVIVVLIIIMGCILAATPRVDDSPKRLLRRLRTPLVAMAVVFLAGAGAFVWQAKRQMDGAVARQMAGIPSMLHSALRQEKSSLIATLQPIAADPIVKQALREGNSKVLLEKWSPVFESLKRENDITHLYFIDARRKCLMRVHNPGKSGDTISRITMMEAERTQKIFSGIELGAYGTFTLRAVQPVFDGGQLLGYVELGKEIEGVLRLIHANAGVDLAVTINKKYLERKNWEDGMRMLHRHAYWDYLSDSVVIYSSHDLPDACIQIADRECNNSPDGAAQIVECSANGKEWQISSSRLIDAADKSVGNLLVLRDVSIEKAAFNRLIGLAGTATMVLLSALISVVYVLLRRTDRGIYLQQSELSESEERLSATLRSIGDGVIGTDSQGCVTSINVVAEQLTGWTIDDARGLVLTDVFKIINVKTRQLAENPVERSLKDGQIVGSSVNTALISRDGREYQISASCAPIRDDDGHIVGAVLVFRDVTDECRQREKLRESNIRFGQLAEQGRIIAWEVDASGKYTYVSDVVHTVLGYRPEDLIGKKYFYDLRPEPEKNAFKAIIFSVFEKQEVFQNLLSVSRPSTVEGFGYRQTEFPFWMKMVF